MQWKNPQGMMKWMYHKHDLQPSSANIVTSEVVLIILIILHWVSYRSRSLHQGLAFHPQIHETLSSLRLPNQLLRRIHISLIKLSCLR